MDIEDRANLAQLQQAWPTIMACVGSLDPAVAQQLGAEVFPIAIHGRVVRLATGDDNRYQYVRQAYVEQLLRHVIHDVIGQEYHLLPVAISHTAPSHNWSVTVQSNAPLLTDLQQQWDSILGAVRQEDKLLHALISNGVQPIAVDEQTVVLAVPNTFTRERLTRPATQHFLTQLFAAYIGGCTTVTCVVLSYGRAVSSDDSVATKTCRRTGACS